MAQKTNKRELKRSIPPKTYGISKQNRGRIRKSVARKYLGKYDEGIREVLQGDHPDYEEFSKKDYREIIKPYIHVIEKLIKEGYCVDRLKDVTMMIKHMRSSFGETTERFQHSTLVAYIAGQIADAIGLDSELVKQMAILHDVGHGPFGHDFEWMAATELKKRLIGPDFEQLRVKGVPYDVHFVHNAQGAWHLLYREDFKQKIMDRIKEEEPDIKPWKIKIIRDHLWLILDGVLTHNGELSNISFVPQVNKTEDDFIAEFEHCYCEEDYDRRIKPATIEACLLRISDIISYVGNDLLDGRREGLIDGLDEQYIELLLKFGVPQELIDEANKNDEHIRQEKKKATTVQELEVIKQEERRLVNHVYGKIEKIIRQTIVDDVIANSDRTAIRLSPEMGLLLYGKKGDNEKGTPTIMGLRMHNNDELVSRVTKDAEKFFIPEGIGMMLDSGREILITEGIIASLEKTPENRQKFIERIKKEYRSEDKSYQIYEQLIDYVAATTPHEYMSLRRIAKQIHSKIPTIKRNEYTEEDIIAMELTVQFMSRMTDEQYVEALRGLGVLNDRLQPATIQPNARKLTVKERIAKRKQIDARRKTAGVGVLEMPYYGGRNPKEKTDFLRSLGEKQGNPDERDS